MITFVSIVQVERFNSSECCLTRLVKNAPEGFSDLEGKYVLKVRLLSSEYYSVNVIQCDDALFQGEWGVKEKRAVC